MNRQRIAEAAGWQDDPVESQVVASETAPVDSGLLDTEDFIEPQLVDQSRPLWNRPFPRIVMVTIPAAIGLWFLVSMVGGNRPPQVAQNPSVAPSSAPSPTPSANDAGDLKTRLALQTQANQLQQKPTATKLPPLPTPVVSRSTPVVPIVQRANSPQSLARSQSPTKSAPVTRTAPVISQPPAKSSTRVRDPVQAWLAAAGIGNYGSLSTSSGTTSPTNLTDTQALGGVGDAPADATPTTATFGTSTGTSSVDISVGTQAKAILQTPIGWTGSVENATQNVLVQLNDPLKASDGTIAMPSGTSLITRVTKADSSGLVQMEATAAIVNEQGRNVQRPLPEYAILILGSNGNPLRASKERSSNFGSDLGIALLSGASKVAGLLNQPQSQTITSSGGFQSTTANGKPNLAAGVAEGIGQALLNRQLQRAQQESQSSSNQPALFVLKQGSPVQVFVNQPVSL
ncbi:TrbI/VirB10 family protein [Leptolyngbya sp. AN03gr2]|uniref:TrbI/VirB10 family protein n=1 Tax=unclassified Leptolyngbya TaxID=2650499 RepID=UPI003D31B768